MKLLKICIVITSILLIFGGCSSAYNVLVYNPVVSGQPPENNLLIDTPMPDHPNQYEEINDNELFYCPVLPIEEPQSAFVEYWLAQLTVEEKIGQLIMPRLPWRATSVNASLRQWMETYHFGGFILFSDNVDSISQVQTLTSDLQSMARLPLLISTDEEGGRVARTGRLFTEPIPPAFDIGRQGDPAIAYSAGRTTGERLIHLGINMNLAPVADIWTNPANAVIGNRAFGTDPETVSIMTEAFVQGLNAEGVLSVIKHFTGHGDTYEDSHYLLAFYHHDRERFDTVESIPFIRGIAAGTDGVMIGHISTPLLQGEQPLLYWMEPWHTSGTLPATFSDFWLLDILRGEMGFDGLIITDGLEMRALTDNFTDEQIAVGAFLAGADILLIPPNPSRAFNALLDAFNNGLFDEARLDESVRRILQAKENFQ